MLQLNQLAALPFDAANGTQGVCPVTDDSQKYDLSAHCNGAPLTLFSAETVQLPGRRC